MDLLRMDISEFIKQANKDVENPKYQTKLVFCANAVERKDIIKHRIISNALFILSPILILLAVLFANGLILNYFDVNSKIVFCLTQSFTVAFVLIYFCVVEEAVRYALNPLRRTKKHYEIYNSRQNLNVSIILYLTKARIIELLGKLIKHSKKEPFAHLNKDVESISNNVKLANKRCS